MKNRSLLVAVTLLATVISVVGCGKQQEVEEIKINEIIEQEVKAEDNLVAEESNTDLVEDISEEVVAETVEEVEVVEQVREITISFAGDCTLGGYKGQTPSGTFGEYYENNGADFFFENVREIFENDDFTVVNLEGPLTNLEQTAQKEFPIKGLPEYVDILSGSSVEAANLANNHMRDCGEAGFEETKQILAENNIGYFGENNLFVTEKNGVRIGFAGYRGWYISDELLEQIKNDMEYIKAEQEADVAVVFFHYGEERQYYNNKDQERISKYVVDCGADIVIGGHPHVVQGIEIYNGKTICYSMGNFSFGANKNPSDKDTFIYQQTFSLNENNEVEYKNHTIIPCRISSRTDWNDCKPTPLHDEDYERVMSRLKEYSSKYDVSIFDIMDNE